MVFLMTYARDALMTTWCDQWYSSINFIINSMSALLTLGSLFGSLYSSLSIFCPVSRHTVSTHTLIVSQSKVHLHQWWNRKTTGFRLSWAISVPLAFLPPGFLMTLQISSFFLSVRTLSLSELSIPCSLTSNLAASGLKSCHMYTSWTHEALISGPYA